MTLAAPAATICTMHLEILEEVPFSVIHHADARGVWASHGRNIYFRATGSRKWQRCATLPFAPKRDVFRVHRLLARAARAHKCSVYPTAAGHLLVIRDGTVYAVKAGKVRALFAISGNCILARGFAEAPDGSVYFGEYFMSGPNDPVRIWRVSKELDSHEAVHTFAPGQIRHVHAMAADPFVPGRLWVTTGDEAGQCRIQCTDNGGCDWQVFGDGSQIWRAVGLLFTPTEVIWCTDSHVEQNYVVAFDRQTRQLQRICTLPSSSWYAMPLTDGWMLTATTVEDGPGVQTNQVELRASQDGRSWQVVAAYTKDRWRPMWLFKFGSLAFPSGVADAAGFWLSGEALDGFDGVSRRCRLVGNAA